MKTYVRILILALGTGLIFNFSSALAQYTKFAAVGDQVGRGHYVDPNLNGWGMASAPGGPFCNANTFTGTATAYSRTSMPEGRPLKQAITIPAVPSQPFGPVGSPTGIVYNPTSEFVISANGKSAPALFIFATLDGAICGWNPEVDHDNAIIMVDNSGEAIPASYTGLTIGQNSQGQWTLYAADGGYAADFSNNRVDMFNGQWQNTGSFTDVNAAVEYPGNTAFQVKNVEGRLFVTFGGFAPPFGGITDIFDMDGNLLTPDHFNANAPGGLLQNPWGIAKVGDGFGKFSHTILIGNVENGKINAFDQTGKWLGTMQNRYHADIVIAGIWEIIYEKDDNEPEGEIYFNAGPYADNFGAGYGIFGIITAR